MAPPSAPENQKRPRTRLLVIGAGSAGQMLVREIVAEGLPVKPVAFLDDNARLHGERICGLPVLGGTGDLLQAAATARAEEILIAIPSATGTLIRRLVLLCRRAGLPFKIAPGIRAIIEGDVRFEQVRPVAPDDLLGRESVTFSPAGGHEIVTGRSVLITGAGGSIGAELCRQLLRMKPATMLMLGRGENSLFEIESELSPLAGDTELRILLADIRDSQRLSVLARRHRPELIFHAAAHKHVPLMEVHPEEAVMVNVVGTANMIRFSRDVQAERFVLISTDKAVAPSSIMGATKKVAELLVRTASENGDATRFMTVRFGNVLGSRGSVIPFFQQRIQAGLPLPITDRRMTRYFMTIKEAVLLVIEAMLAGEPGATYVLEMGEPVSIFELANNLLALSGYDPVDDDDGPGIVFTGLRAGERLHEALFEPDEQPESCANPLLMKAVRSGTKTMAIAGVVESLQELAQSGDQHGLRRRLAEILQSQELLAGDAADDQAS